MARCIRVPAAEGEGVRKRLIEAGLLDLDHRIRAEGGSLCIPVLADSFEGYRAETADVPEQPRRETDYKELANVPSELKCLLPSSYDVIGDVIVVKLADELTPYESQIAEALLATVKSVRAVFLDTGVQGELRIRGLKKISGRGESETVHKESGVRLMTDPSLVYFNPRLATERERVASLVADGEVIIDMFAGVAPFGTVICRHANPKAVYSIDLNPECLRFMEENIRMNGIGNMVPMIGDSAELVKGLPKADRVIMNLPQSADEFLVYALGAAKPGATVHMHKILERGDLRSFEERIVFDMREAGYGISVARVSELKTYSPTMSVYVFDIIAS
ncbi:class I SAM-dependent methyltransferase family protein [Methanomassiliicoccaceae archaeon COG_1]|nr:class I SAM-dependent methyltransferase family protein [Methanomassiliicoccaceae archaeon COG_1]